MKQAGFTLIELMIAVAIVGILVTLAIPAYHDYTVRARITEVLYLAAKDKAAVSEFFLAQNSLPQTAEEAGINTSVAQSSYLTDEVQIEDGVIIYSLGNLGHNAAVGSLLFTPTATVDGILWACSSPDNTGIPNRFLPAECRKG